MMREGADLVLVSEVTTYLRCPRLVYFRSRKHTSGNEQKDVNTKYLSHLILKELALTYHRAVKSDCVAETLRTELDRIVNELPTVYRAELGDLCKDGDICDISEDGRSMIREAADEIKIDAIGSRIADAVRTTGRDEILTRITPCAVEYAMYSDALGIAGAPDKLVRRGGAVLPCVIKTGNAPDQGVWRSDRLQITAYAMLVEETFGKVVEHGFVEYARSFDLREVVIRSRDRRRVLELRNRIKAIKDGRMPDRPRDAPCEFCAFEEDCRVTRSLASKFF